MKTLAGGCDCGGVTYTVADEFEYASNCHCSRCRASTGAAFKPFAGIAREKLELAQGADRLMIVGEPDNNHMFVGSKATWYEILDDLPQFDGYPE
jgi:hypothetical protein